MKNACSGGDAARPDTNLDQNGASDAAANASTHTDGGEAGGDASEAVGSRAITITVEIAPVPALGLPGAPGAPAEDATAAPKRRRGRTRLATIARSRPELAASYAAIDERFASAGERDEQAVLLAKIAEYRAWLVQQNLLPTMKDGLPEHQAVLAAVGHPETTPTDDVGAAIDALAELAAQDSPYYRSDVDPEVDVLIDLYKTVMEARGHGIPRVCWNGRRSWRRAAKEIGCAEEQLTPRRRQRLLLIDAAVGEGEAVGMTHFGGSRMDRIGTAIELIGEEVERRRGSMPADPLQPDRIDDVELAEAAGASPRDFQAGPRTDELRTLVEAGRDGKPLVPHPLVAGRRFDFRHLIQEGRALRVAEAKAAGVGDEKAAGRVTVAALRRFLSLPDQGFAEGDLVPLDLPERVEAALAQGPDFDSGWPAQMRKWIGYYHAARSGRPLPAIFATAIKILAVEAGLTITDLRNASSSYGQWMLGSTFPSHEAQASLDRLEDMLRVTRGTLNRLLAREWRSRRLEVGVSQFGYGGIARKLPLDLAEKSEEEMRGIMADAWKEYKAQGNAFARRQSARVRDHYRLPFISWPQAMKDAWDAQMPRTADRAAEEPDDGGLREAGTRPTDQERHSTPKEEDRSWSQKTHEMGEYQLGFFLGFLRRPLVLEAHGGTGPRRRPAQPLQDGDKPFEPEPGLEIDMEYIHPALFAAVDLFTLYGHWKRDRAGGRFAPSTAATLRLAAAFLKPGTGLVWKNEKECFKELEKFHRWLSSEKCTLRRGAVTLDIEAFREDWHYAIGEVYDVLRKDIKDLTTRKRKSGPRRPAKLRDPFAPLAAYLDEADPMQAYMVGVRQMLASRPLSMIDRHEHRRNGILSLIAVQTGLRAGNLLLTISGPDPTLRREKNRAGVVRWRVVIPAAQFKNWFSPFFSDGEPYVFTLDDEDGLYAMLDDYIARGRRYLLAGKSSDALFVTRFGNAFIVPVLSDTYRKLTSMFYVRDKEAGTGIEGVRPHGIHAVRHVIATSLLKTTRDIYQAAYAIQDTTATVERNYVKYLPRDKALLAVAQLRKSRAVAAAAPLAIAA